MRLVELRLVAFGPFADVTMDFSRPEAGLHLVYGTNEAGKSTTLRAVTGLLYGIPQQSPDTHRHDAKDLRIGGRVSSRDGATLDFVRRKGRKATLLSPDGTPIPDSALTPFLCGVTEAAFKTMFGLDHESLRSGAQAMLEGRGEIGESLFSASLGGRGVHRLLEELRAEGEDLFTPKGRSGKRIVQSVQDYREAKGVLELRSTGGRAFVDNEEQLARSRARRAELLATRDALTAEQSRLQRIRRVWPHVSQRAEVLARIAALGEVVLLPPGAGEERGEARRSLEGAEREAVRLREDIAELERELAAMDVPETLLSLEPSTVEDVIQRLGVHKKAAVDLPKRGGELKSVEQDIERILRTLGRDIPVSEVERLRPDPARVALVRGLAGKQAKLAAELSHAEASLARLEAKRTHAAERIARFPAPAHVEPLEQALADARRHGDIEARLRQLDLQCGRLREDAEKRLASIGLYSGGLDGVAGLPLPLPETVERFDGRYRKLHAQREQAGARGRQIAEREREVTRGIDELRGEGDVPTETELAARREERDAAWSRLKHLVVPREPVPDAVLSAFEALAYAADNTADRLRREAARAARLASLLAEAKALASARATATEDVTTADAEIQAIEAEYRGAFEPAGIEPLPPGDMRAWLGRFASLERSVADLKRAEAERADLVLRQRSSTDLLKTALGSGGAMDGPGADRLAFWVDVAEREVERARTAERERRALAESLVSLDADLAVARGEAERHRGALATWAADWNAAADALGVRAGSTPEEALAVLDALTELFGRVDDAADLRRRIAGMERDSRQLVETVRSLCQRYLPELSPLAWTEAAEELSRRHARAKRSAEERQRLSQQLASKRRALRDTERERTKASERLTELMRAARVSDLPALEGAERASSELRQLVAAREQVEREIVRAGEGVALDALVDQAKGYEGDAVGLRLSAIESELEGVVSELQEVAGDIATLEQGLLRMQAGGAAEAADAVQNVVSRLRSQVRRYVRVRLASALLEREIELYRERHQGPILARASEIFPRLTRGRYAALRIGFDSGDEASLRAVRADGNEVPVEGLSDGTRDQLYLALRLSTLERHAERSEPMPLVLDDILIQSDDERAEAALQVMSDMAERFQILFFTHHHRLVEIARRAVDKSRYREHFLPAAKSGH